MDTETKFFVRYKYRHTELRDECGPFDERLDALTHAASMLALFGAGAFKFVDVIDRECWMGANV